MCRLQKVLIKSCGKEESAIAVYLESDRINQYHVGFLQRYFVAHVRFFDGVWRRSRRCIPSPVIAPSSKRMSSQYGLLPCFSCIRIAENWDEYEEEEEEDASRLLLQRNDAIAVYDDPPSALPTAVLVQQQEQTATINVASAPPPAVRAQ